MASLFTMSSNDVAAAANNPPTLTCAFLPNAMPLGLNTQTLPPLLPLIIPSIWDLPLVPDTLLNKVEPALSKLKFALSPADRLNCVQSIIPPFESCWIVVTFLPPTSVVVNVPNTPAF